jgi:glutamyl-tRNA reductase
VSEELFVAGLNHQSASVEIREQLALEEDKIREIAAGLLARGLVTEVAILATCNRVEVWGVAPVVGEARTAAFTRLGAHRGVYFRDVEPHLYTRTGEEAIRHVFRVASSLDSMVVGEPQILGQVKDAFALAQSAEVIGPQLRALVTQALAVARKIRRETGIGRHAVSVSYAAVELARKIFGGLEGKAVLLVGAGEMAELAARHLMEHGTLPVRVANRTHARGEELARRLQGLAVPFDRLSAAMAEVDIVIASTAAPQPIITRSQVQEALRARHSRPLFLVDIAVPRNVEAGVNDLDNAFCYDVDDLRAVVEANLRERAREARAAEAMVTREVERFRLRLRDLEVVPTIVSLRDKVEGIRRAEVERALRMLPQADAETRRVIEAMSHAIVNKVLHTPTVKLRDSSRAGVGQRVADLIGELFGLGPGKKAPPADGA